MSTTSNNDAILWNASLPILKRSEILPDMRSNLSQQQTGAQTDVEHTACSTLRTRSSSLLSRAGGSNNNCSCSQEIPKQKKEVTNKKRLSLLLSRVNIRTRRWSRRRKSISETNLRKKLKKNAEKGEWDAVRKLLSKYDFDDIPIPEPLPLPLTPLKAAPTNNNRNGDSSSDKGKTYGKEDEPATVRRPSYGSRNSFESAAAAAAFKAALFDESSPASPSSERLDVGENVLHDICRCNPPLDVIETLLTSLRHRRDCTSGKDEMGRTPLHVAAACGASPDVIDALARADPCPASIGDIDGRTPLHIAVMYLAYSGRLDNYAPEEIDLAMPYVPSVRQEEPFNETERERFATTISILKEVMMAHPGKVDFKDEDKTGFSPLDYAIDGSITDRNLLHCLLRRKGLTTSKRRSTASVDTQVMHNLPYQPLRKRSWLNSDASSTCSQDIEVLIRLEEEEINVRRKRVEMMRTRQKKVKIRNTLFDMFGIDQVPGEETPDESPKQPEKAYIAENERKVAEERPTQPEKAEKVSDDSDLQNLSRRISSRRLPCRASFRSNLTSSSSRKKRSRQRESDLHKSITSEDIYNAHLEAYMKDFLDDGLEFRDEDDSFDIFHDPDEDDDINAMENVVHDDSTLESGRPPIIEINILLDDMNDALNDDALNDDLSQCSRFGMSVVSEVSVPAVLVNRET